MTLKLLPLFVRLALVACAWVTSLAFPPAPHHLYYGTVRDEYGLPLSVENAEVILQSSSGQTVRTMVLPGLGPDRNYELPVPVDAGVTSDLYRPNVLRPKMPFAIQVRIGSSSYVPMEVSGNLTQLGRASKSTLLNLTLAIDSDNDGLPDAWEQMLIAYLGGNKTLADINPNDDPDGDGLSNFAEYSAGTFAFDDNDGLAIDIAGFNGESPQLRFLAVRNRTYAIYLSSDLQTWTPATFIIPADAPNAVPHYRAVQTKELLVEVPGLDKTTNFFFRLRAY